MFILLSRVRMVQKVRSEIKDLPSVDTDVPLEKVSVQSTWQRFTNNKGLLSRVIQTVLIETSLSVQLYSPCSAVIVVGSWISCMAITHKFQHQQTHACKDVTDSKTALPTQKNNKKTHP